MSWEPLPPERGRGRDPSLSYVPHGSAVIYTPPTPRGNAWDHEEESDGGRMESGPSDYARRAWIGGLEAHRRASEGSDEAADGSDEWSRQRRRRRRRRVSAGIGGKVGDDEEAREMICRADKHPTRTRTHSPPTPRPRRRSATRRLAAAISTTALLSSLPIARAAPAPSGKSPSQTPRDIPTPTFSPTVAVFTRDVPTKPTTVFAQVEWQRQKRDGVQYLTSAEPPTMMPTDIRNVPETALPYLFSQGSDGGWVRVQGGWKLYGRQVGATQTATWAVESALPYGWGSQSTRTDFYRVPLIVVAAVVLAVSIVIWIAVTAFKRRKQHRRQKRRAERLRRRALAAAGLSEQDARDEEAQRKFEEKLDELQRERRMKKGEQFGRGASTGRGREAKGERAKASRVKVRLWSAGTGLGLGLRRRRGARGGNGGSGAGGGDGDDAGSDGDGRTPRPGSLSSIADDGSPKPPAPGPELDISRATRGTGQGQGQGQGQRRSQDTDRSTPTVPSSHTALESGLPSRENTTTEDSTESRDRSDRFSSLGSTRAGDSPDSDRRYAQLQGAAGTGTGTGTGTGAGAGTAGATYFPPAYRPASVRSLPAAGSSRPSGFGPASSARHASHAGQQGELDPHGHATGSGLGSFDNDDDDEHGHSHGHANEKTRAPGYYPAPSTAEGEVALAVASRAEGKQRVMDPEADAAIRAQAQAHPQLGDDEGEGVLQRGHVATDDKRVLEQMRLAASAPPARAYSPGDNGGVHAIGPTDGEEAGEEAVRGIGYGSGGEQGPSAPYIETDQDGFETLPPSLSLGTPIDHSEYASSSTHTPTSPNVSTRNQPSSPHAHTRPSHMSLHPDIPLPPARQPTRTLSMREEVEREVHEQLDELNLLPSAPPVPLPLTRGLSVPSAPSAPPDLGLEDGEADGREDSASGAPSAPPLEMEEDGAENDVPREPSVAGASATASATASGEVEGHDQAGSGGVRVEGRFLPRYEP